MRTIGYGNTDVGRLRERNEDRLLVDMELGLYAVADGMGGHRGGDLAATIAIDTVERVVRRYLAAFDVGEEERLSSDVLAFIVKDALRQASREVYTVANTARYARGMGCTLTVLLVRDGVAAMAHVGDSRLYLLRDGLVRQLSEDHTIVAELLKVGALTPAQAVDHHSSHILTRAIGTTSEVEIDVSIFDVEVGDRFLICSDGLSDTLGDGIWLSEVLDEEILKVAVERLIGLALAHGGEDNITAVVVSVESGTGPEWSAPPWAVLEEPTSDMTPV